MNPWRELGGKERDEIPDDDEIESWLENEQFDRLDLTVIEQAHKMLESF